VSSIWEELLGYVRAHPRDPRAPEALYWLIHVSYCGTGHNRSGYCAFMLLHERYPGSTWAKQSKYYYD
jgi:TolA-binding protein